MLWDLCIRLKLRVITISAPISDNLKKKKGSGLVVYLSVPVVEPFGSISVFGTSLGNHILRYVFPLSYFYRLWYLIIRDLTVNENNFIGFFFLLDSRSVREENNTRPLFSTINIPNIYRVQSTVKQNSFTSSCRHV